MDLSDGTELFDDPPKALPYFGRSGQLTEGIVTLTYAAVYIYIKTQPSESNFSEISVSSVV